MIDKEFKQLFEESLLGLSLTEKERNEIYQKMKTEQNKVNETNDENNNETNTGEEK